MTEQCVSLRFNATFQSAEVDRSKPFLIDKSSLWISVDSLHRGLLNGPSTECLYEPYVARLAAKQQTGVSLLGRYITAHDPSMARLLNAARAIFGPAGISNEKACLHMELTLYKWRWKRLSSATHQAYKSFILCLSDDSVVGLKQKLGSKRVNILLC